MINEKLEKASERNLCYIVEYLSLVADLYSV